MTYNDHLVARTWQVTIPIGPREKMIYDIMRARPSWTREQCENAIDGARIELGRQPSTAAPAGGGKL